MCVKNRLVTVVIPLYNQVRYVREAIQSALDQDYTSFEVVVVDDGSTDGSRQVVAEFGDSVRYIYQKNQGLAGARNTGIGAAKGELIGLLDADDQWMPGFLKQMTHEAEQYPDAAVYYCGAHCMDIEGLDLPRKLGIPVREPEEMYWTLLRLNFLIPSTILLRRSVALAAGLFDDALRSCEDWDLWLRILPEGKIVGINQCLTRYRIHHESLSANLDGMHRAAQAVIEKNFGADDHRVQTWSPEKRRAYGGLYRYQSITYVQHRGDWPASGAFLERALNVDPTLAYDIDYFYELACGMQSVGHRGTRYGLDLEGNASRLEELVCNLFGTGSKTLRHQTLGTAYFALGLLAYNTVELTVSRRFLSRALWYRPELFREKRVTWNLIKSSLVPGCLKLLRNRQSRV